jgi:hypothetical protein
LHEKNDTQPNGT